MPIFTLWHGHEPITWTAEASDWEEALAIVANALAEGTVLALGAQRPTRIETIALRSNDGEQYHLQKESEA
jgi:hypothetical protein